MKVFLSLAVSLSVLRLPWFKKVEGAFVRKTLDQRHWFNVNPTFSASPRTSPSSAHRIADIKLVVLANQWKNQQHRQLKLNERKDEGVEANCDTKEEATSIKSWRTTGSGLRVVDDAIGSGEILENGTVVKVKCEAELISEESRSIFIEPPLDGFQISKDNRGITLVCVYHHSCEDATSEAASSVWQDSLQGMRVGSRRRVLIPPASASVDDSGVAIRFVGLGAVGTAKEALENSSGTIRLDIEIEGIEPVSSRNAIIARSMASGGIPAALAFSFGPILSPLGLLALLFYTPLLVKKTVNIIAMLELYLDVEAGSNNPLQILLDWKLKF